MPASANWPDRVMTRPILRVSCALAGAALASRAAATPLSAVMANRIVILPEMSWRGMEHRQAPCPCQLGVLSLFSMDAARLFHPRLHRILNVLDLVDLQVAQAIGCLLDLLDVDGENDVARLRVDLDRTARALPLHAFGRRDQRVTVGFAAGLLQRLVDQVHAVVPADRKDIRIALVVDVKRLGECLAL